MKEYRCPNCGFPLFFHETGGFDDETCEGWGYYKCPECGTVVKITWKGDCRPWTEQWREWRSREVRT